MRLRQRCRLQVQWEEEEWEAEACRVLKAFLRTCPLLRLQ